MQATRAPCELAPDCLEPVRDARRPDVRDPAQLVASHAHPDLPTFGTSAVIANAELTMPHLARTIDKSQVMDSERHRHLPRNRDANRGAFERDLLQVRGVARVAATG